MSAAIPSTSPPGVAPPLVTRHPDGGKRQRRKGVGKQKAATASYVVGVRLTSAAMDLLTCAAGQFVICAAADFLVCVAADYRPSRTDAASCGTTTTSSSRTGYQTKCSACPSMVIFGVGSLFFRAISEELNTSSSNASYLVLIQGQSCV